MIEVRNVTHAFGKRVVLRNISVNLNERRIAIVGSNGCGKSTFARLLNGLHIPSEGEVLVDGLDTRTEGKAVRRKVGFVFQNPDNQIVLPTVAEDLAFGMKNLGFGKLAIEKKVDDVLSCYGMASLKEHPSHLLSGGQKQLLAISGVLVMDPEYIVFDEPTTLLDLKNKRKIADAISRLNQTVIVVSHDLEILEGFDRALVFDDGNIIIDDVPSVALREYVKLMS
jgi:biotin transport system ATP-binding protein